jgi:hypothetical protein
MLNLIGIKIKQGIYVTDFTKEKVWSYSEYSHYNSCIDYLFDGKRPTETFDKYWVLIDKEPEKIQQYKSQPNINYRYELIENEITSQLKDIPKVLKDDDIEKDQEGYWIGKYELLRNYYKSVSDKQPDILIDIEFTYKTILELDEVKDFGTFNYKVNYSSHWNNHKTEVNGKNIFHQLIDGIVFPEILISSKPCALNSEDSYAIVRNYVKENINPRYAEITSDYDFCFTVKKKISLIDKIEYSIDVNNSWFGKRKRKPKYEKRFRSHRLIEVFNMAPKPYQGYKVINGFMGKDQEDLKNNIDDYCKQLIEFINEPLVDCPHCNGEGVIFEKEFELKK